MHPATIEALSRLRIAKAGRRSAPGVPTASAIVREAAKRIGLDWRTCSPADRLRLLHSVRLLCRAWLRMEGEKLAAVLYPEDVAKAVCSIKAYVNERQVEATLYRECPTYGYVCKGLLGDTRRTAERFFDRAGRFVRASVMAGWLAVAGPSDVPAQIEAPIAPGPLAPLPAPPVSPVAAAPPLPPNITPDQAAADALRRAINEQMAFLHHFAQEVVEEGRPFVPARAEQYGSACWGAAQQAAQRQSQARLFREARREHRGGDRPCNGCAYWVKRGWVPIEEIAPIGSQSCRQACHCVIIVRDDADGSEYDLGRMPNVGRNISPKNFRSLGVRFRHGDAAAAQGYRTVIIDVRRLDAAWQHDRGFFIGPDGSGAIGGRIAGFRAYLERAQREGLPIDQSRATLDPDGTVSFADGRHRFAYFRDRGIEQLPISVPAEQADEFRRLFGWGETGSKHWGRTDSATTAEIQAISANLRSP